MDRYFSSYTERLIIQTTILLIILVAVFFVYKFIFEWVSKKASKTPGEFDDYVLRLFRGSLLWFIYWFLLNILIHIFYSGFSFFPKLLHLNNLLLIFTIAWLSVQFVTAVAYVIQSRYDLSASDNLRARKNLTQVKVFKAVTISIIIIIAIGVALMTFEQARKVGISILTSAGILGIIVGFAAQKSLAMILAGIQLAITQPIRIDDIVIVEGEFGRIEEIELTYVILNIWDERRMVIPVTWFLEKPFQNLTRTNSNTTGSIFFFLDYNFPVESLRKILPSMLQDNTNWDGRIANIQVTNSTEKYKEIRVLLSSSDSTKNWDLRTGIREKMIDFINANYPDAFAGIRIKTV
jgi:small-conductance mechanosensitive channel